MALRSSGDALLLANEENLSVPIRAITDELTCPICFETLKGALCTPCSHNFCAPCLRDCLNVRHICPVCNAQTKFADCRPNLALDRVVTLAREAAEEAQKRYVETLFGGPSNKPNGNGQNNGNGNANARALTPIELMLQKHLSRCSRSFEEYHSQLRHGHDLRIAEIRSELEQRAKGVSHDAAKSAALKAEFEQRTRALNSEFEHTLAMLSESYEKYLEALVPAPARLPVLVTVVVPSKGFEFERLRLQPTDTPREIKAWLREQMIQRGDPIVDFAPSNVFALFRSAGDFALKAAPVLLDETLPISLQNPEPGAVVAVQGNLRCQSDAPKRCFRHRYNKDAPPQQVDYFTCRDCKLNWLCPECAQLCHVKRGHTVTEYMKAHTPTWGCCYCVKGNGCNLVEKQ